MGLHGHWRRGIAASMLALCAAGGAFGQVVDRSTLTGKIVCGYQGWFSCPGDGNATSIGWNHWSKSSTDIGPGLYNIDLWPDVTSFDPDELFAAPNVQLLDGSTGSLFSSRTLKTVERHFKWMRENGIDGVLLQRFLASFGGVFFQQRNAVTQCVRSAAGTYGRVFAIEYDISGGDTSTLYNVITTDWKYLIDTYALTGDPRYLHHNGRPVVGIWGFGFGDRPGTPAVAAQIIDFFRNDPVYGGNTIMGGVPTSWRTNTTWASVFRSFDIISPWTVGSYGTSTSSINGSRNNVTVPDLAECSSLGIGYLQVFWPGFSWDNLQGYPPGTSNIPRNGGQFFWDQANAFQSAGVQMMKIAMFDEVDEGTAILKVTTNHPVTDNWVDYGTLPTDWYLRLAGAATKMLRKEIPVNSTLPSVLPIDARCNGDEASINLGEDTADRMTHVQVGDGDTTVVTQAGVLCRRNVSSSSDLYMYFAVDDAFALAGSVPEVCITIDYYDTGGSSGALRLQYDSSDPAPFPNNYYKDGGSVTLSTANRWKRKIFHVSDAYFGNRQNNGADFRINLAKSGGGLFYLDRVLVTSAIPRPPTFEVAPASFTHAILRGGTLTSDTFTIRNVGWLPADYTLTPTAPWLSVSPGGGTGSGETDTATIDYSISGLSGGNYVGSIQVSAPGASNAPQISVNLVVYHFGDMDHDQDVDQSDFGRFQACLSVAVPPLAPECEEADSNGDHWVDGADFEQFRQCLAGPNRPPGC